jgi:hypothetical protein
MGPDIDIVRANVEWLRKELKSYIDEGLIGNFFVGIGKKAYPGGVGDYDYNDKGEILKSDAPPLENRYHGSFIFAQLDPGNRPYYLKIDSGTLQEDTPKEAARNLRATRWTYNQEPHIDGNSGSNAGDGGNGGNNGRNGNNGSGSEPSGRFIHFFRKVA